jgi:zona occludens toxin
MITLITGTPGAGKTLFALSEVYPQFAGRPVYVDGVPELLLDHELPAGTVESDGKGSKDYSTWLPENAVLIVDECQRIWRPRSASSAVPDGVRAMETHRHHGHDLVLITQHPNLLDSNVRRLVGRHLHVRRVWGWNRALVYEWDQATDPNRISTATKRSWAYPKSAFGIYKSASVHTSRGQRPPFLFYAAVLLPLVFVAVAYQAYTSINHKIAPPSSLVGASADATTKEKAQVGYAPESFKPVNPDVPLSAPAFDHLRQVVSMPRVIGCISTKSRCQCYTQQGTPAYLSDSHCRYMASHSEFDPYLPPQQASYAPPATSAAVVEPPRYVPGAFDPKTMQLGVQLPPASS